MRRIIRAAAMLLCSIFLLAACAAPVLSPADERLLSDVRTQYRNSALVVEGIGAGKHIDALGHECHDISILEIYAGTADESAIVHLKDNPILENERYLLFLGEGEDVHYAEDTIGYTLLSGEALRILDDEVLWDSKRIPLTELKARLSELSAVISAPTPVLYYDSLKTLAQAADEILIGRVAKLPPMSRETFSMRDGGTVERAMYDASIATIEVFGSIKGGYARYGETLELVYSPERASSMLDAATLQPMPLPYISADELREQDICLFFLKDGPDSKQSYHFLINPVQGFVRVSGDNLYPISSNSAVKPFKTLTQIVGKLHSALAQEHPVDDDAPLLIIDEG